MDKKMNFLKSLFNKDVRMYGAFRSGRWAFARKTFLLTHPACEVCRRTTDLNVHHKKPFHLFPALELDPRNLVTLCESKGMNCHFVFGHLANWKSYNTNIDEDVIIWHSKITNRP